MENSFNQEPIETPNVRAEVTPDSENFDEKGAARVRRELPDGTIAFLSDEEYKAELESQRN